MPSVIVRLQGGLGNQLFQYARGVSLNSDRQADLYFDYRVLDEDLSLGGGNRRKALAELGLFAPEAPPGMMLASRALMFVERFPRASSLLRRLLTNRLFGFATERRFSYSAGQTSSTKILFVEGYWQSPKYFVGVEDTIRAAVLNSAPDDEHFRQLQRRISGTRSACVHVRRGDYLRHPQIDFHGVLPPEYYVRAANYLKQNFAVDVFFIFSDDPKWCEENLRLSENQVIIANEDYRTTAGNDLKLMACGTYFIIANSSFSWWGAWLANVPHGRVVAPARWFMNPDIDTSDLLPSGWVVL